MRTKIVFWSILFILSVKANAQSNLEKFYKNNVLYVKLKDKTVDPITLTSTARRDGFWKKVYNVSEEKLKRYRENAAQKLHRRIHDPNLEFRFYLSNPSEIKNVKKELEADSLVEYVLFVPKMADSSAPDYFSLQSYIHNIPSGINAEVVWTEFNNRGSGIKLCDIESTFNAAHTDLPPITRVGSSPPPQANTNHGTATLGEIVALNNGIGTTGIASDCDVYFSSVFTGPNYDDDLAGAIINAMDVLSAGDILLLEQHIPGPVTFTTEDPPNSQFGFVPVEWYKPYYDAIALAVGQGIIVIEAAGNGSQNLDDPIYSMDDPVYGNVGHYPFLPGNGSGAILVGAGAVDPVYGGSDVARSRLYFSNYGSCVQLQGDGESVCTTGYGNLYMTEGINNAYTSSFGGTSSASPIVAGAAILLQSVYEQATGERLSLDQMREFLIATGQPQQSGSFSKSQHIGPLPNVYAAIQNSLIVLGTPKNELTIRIYPNPTNGELTITSKNAQNAKLTVRNSLGQAVYTLQLSFTEDTILLNLNDQPKGVYFIEYKTNTSLVTKKIVVR